MAVSLYRHGADSVRTSSAPSVAALFDHPAHAERLEGAPHRGRAWDEDRRVVDLAVWMDDAGAIRQTRFKATTCVSLIACAERACQLLEEGTSPSALDADRLIHEVSGLHPMHHQRAHLVVEALRQALEPSTSPR